jgi:DNA-binding NarL/FixJ family response regulator
MSVTRAPTFLFVEPHGLLRATVVGVASMPGAARLMRERRFDGLLLALEEAGEAPALLERLRDGALCCRRDMAVAVLAAACDSVTVARLKALAVRRVLLKPFRVRQMLEAVERLGEPAPAGDALPPALAAA